MNVSSLRKCVVYEYQAGCINSCTVYIRTYSQLYINLSVDWDFLITIFVNNTNSYQEV